MTFYRSIIVAAALQNMEIIAIICYLEAEIEGAGKLGRSKVGLGKLGLGKLGFGKVGR